MTLIEIVGGHRDGLELEIDVKFKEEYLYELEIVIEGYEGWAMYRSEFRENTDTVYLVWLQEVEIDEDEFEEEI